MVLALETFDLISVVETHVFVERTGFETNFGFGSGGESVR